MSWSVLEVALIPFFILLNGFFAGAELAVLSARRGKLAEKAKAGSRAAAIALRLRDNPGRFLPTVQIGITIVGTLAGTFGGLSLVTILEAELADRLTPTWAHALAVTLVVGSISFLTLVIGELAPKNIALKYAESYALVLAFPMSVLQRLLHPIVVVLEQATNLVLLPFGGKASELDKVTRDEIRHAITEGHRQGIYSATERAILHSVFEMVNRTVKDVAVPRHEVPIAEPNATLGELRTVIVKATVPFVVLYDPTGDVVHGLVGWREVFSNETTERAVHRSLRLVFVPESAPLPKAIEQIQATGVPAAIVVNEYGEFEGLLSLVTLAQRQVFALTLPSRMHPGIKTLSNGWLIRGDVPLHILREQLALPLEDSVFYTTLGGFVLEALGRLPVPGDAFELYGYRFTVRNMQARRVGEVEVLRT